MQTPRMRIETIFLRLTTHNIHSETFKYYSLLVYFEMNNTFLGWYILCYCVVVDVVFLFIFCVIT